jgi:hypothetical protein
MKSETNIDAPSDNEPDIHPEDTLLMTLCKIYQAAGLSPEHAFRSARADYECNFPPVTSCAA